MKIIELIARFVGVLVRRAAHAYERGRGAPRYVLLVSGGRLSSASRERFEAWLNAPPEKRHSTFVVLETDGGERASVKLSKL